MIYNTILQKYCSSCGEDVSMKVDLYTTKSGVDIHIQCLSCLTSRELSTDVLPSLLDFSRLKYSRFVVDYEEWGEAAMYYMRNNPWIQQFMDEKGWWWICVCGGRVVGGSADRQTFPTKEERERISEQNDGFVPLCYTQPIVSEEGGGVNSATCPICGGELYFEDRKGEPWRICRNDDLHQFYGTF